MENDKKTEATEKQKNMVVLYGKDKSGKTHIIKEIFKILYEKYRELPSCKVLIWRGIRRKKELLEKKDANSADCICESCGDIVIIIIIDDFSVGILSPGDPRYGKPDKRLIKGLEWFKEENCNIIFCAARHGGEEDINIAKKENPIIQYIETYSKKNGYDTEYRYKCKIEGNNLQPGDKKLAQEIIDPHENTRKSISRGIKTHLTGQARKL